ncbi:MAG: hypothetical protein ACXIVQ_06255 [Acidimicrobiales bacterium]
MGRPRPPRGPHRPDQHKHRGLTYFAFPMRQAGVEVRPLREMTGRALFNEVFLSDARAPHAEMIGDLNDGWRVANTTLMVERAGIGGANAAAPSAAIAGTIAGHLDQLAGRFATAPAGGTGGTAIGRGKVRWLAELARQRGRADDPVVRDGLARLHSLVEITTWHMGRMKSGNAATGGESNLAKIRNSQMVALACDLGCTIAGPGASLIGPDAITGGRAARADPVLAGAVDLRRHRPDAAQHRRRARARPAQGARAIQGHPVPRPAEERDPPRGTKT